MPRMVNENARPREYWVTYLATDGAVTMDHGERPVGEVDSGLFGNDFSRPKVQILEYGVALWGKNRKDSRTVIPWNRVLQIEEVF